MSDFARLSVAEVADALREAPADELPELRATLAAAAVDESVPLTSRDFALMVVEASDRMSTGVDPADVFRTLEAAYRLKGTPGEGVTSIQERLDPLPRTGRQG